MRRLTPLGLALVALICIVAAVSGFMAVAAATGENPLAVFRETNQASVVEIWFPERDNASGVGIGNDTDFRVATLVGPERAVTVICPRHFEPDVSRVYLASERRFDTSDGRLAPPVWTLIVDRNGYPIFPRHP